MGNKEGKMDRQELKDRLQRLTEDVETATNAIRGKTFDAWGHVIERGNYRSDLTHAANLARDLWNRIQATIEEIT